MKTIIIVFFGGVLLLSACRKQCDSSCPCKSWYEGTNCDTPMRDKFAGTFIGTLYGNGTNPKLDTIAFTGSLEPINWLSNVKEIVSMPDSTVELLSIINSTQASCYISFTTPNLSKVVDCGSAQITSDGHKLTMLYSPLVSTSGALDTSVIYTFIGYKQ